MSLAKRLLRSLMVVGIWLVGFLLAIVGLGLYLKFTKDPTTTGFTQKQLYLLEKIRLESKTAGFGASDVDNVDKIITTSTDEDDVCFEVGCLESALEIMSGLNLSADPCALQGGWLDFVCSRRGMTTNCQLSQLDKVADRNTKILLEEGTTGASEFLLDAAKVYYQQCQGKGSHNLENIRDIVNYNMNTGGGWPLLTNQTPSVHFSWLDAVADQVQFNMPGFASLFFKLALANSKTTNGMQVKLGIGRLSFFGGENKLEYSQLQKTMDSMRDMGQLETSADVMDLQLKAAYQFMENLSTSITQLNETSVEESLTLSQLQDRTDHYFQERAPHHHHQRPAVSMNWTRFFERVFAETGFQVGTEETIVISLPVIPILGIGEAVELEMMREEPTGRQNVVNSLQLNVGLMLLAETTSILEEQSSCVDKVIEKFGLSLGKSYLNRWHYGAGSLVEPRVRSLMEEIRQSYLELIESPPWMMTTNSSMAAAAASTTQFLQEKVRTIKLNLIQPDWLKEDEQGTRSRSKLVQFYEGLEISPNSSFAKNFLNANSWQIFRGNLDTVRRHRAMWEKRELNAFDLTWNPYLGQSYAAYYPPVNDVVLLAGMLREPVFELNRPAFMNYAGLGTIIGHEIGHSITSGRKLDKCGDDSCTTEHWDPNSLRMYEQWANDTAEFYDSVPFQVTTNLTMQLTAWNSTLTEDLTDMLGIQAAFAAYRKHLEELKRNGEREKVLPGLTRFTPEQLFYMKYAIMWCEKPDPDLTDFSGLVHSRPNRRADLPLRLSKQFKNAFNCDLNNN